MLIRSKLLLSAAVSVTAVIAMFGLQLYTNSVESELSHAAQNVLELERDVLLLRKNEKDFLAVKIFNMLKNINKFMPQLMT